jgi:transposase
MALQLRVYVLYTRMILTQRLSGYWYWWFFCPWGMDKFTLEHRVFLYDTYVKCKSARKCQRKFRRKFPGVRIPHRNTIQNLVNKVRSTGEVMDRKPERPRRVLTEEKLGAIAARLERSPHKSLKRLAEEMGVSKGTMRTATKLLKLRLHTTRLMHSLQPRDPVCRLVVRPMDLKPSKDVREVRSSTKLRQSPPHPSPVKKWQLLGVS